MSKNNRKKFRDVITIFFAIKNFGDNNKMKS